MSLSNTLLRVEGVSKHFGAVKALENVSFEIKQGEILGLVGDNGAGKSTLLKIIAGALQPTSGEIYFDGRKVRFKDTSDSLKVGIAIAHQLLHEQLVDIRTVWENFFAGRELTKRIGLIEILDIKRMRTRTDEALKKYGLNIDVNKKIKQLSEEERQVIALMKAIEQKPKLLLLDESFTFLSLTGKRTVIELLRKLNWNDNVSIILVSHEIPVVKELAHNILILKEGEKVYFGPSESISADQIIKFMRKS
jgi:ABC-type sugar transport system ATPase subunit